MTAPAPAAAPTPGSSPTPSGAAASAVNPLISELKVTRDALWKSLSSRIVGQQATIAALLTGLFARGHVLLIGPPGVAKTLLVRTLAQSLGWSFKRIQFTPDLMPSDITGTELLREDRATGARSFTFAPGPVFANLVLADEINRATPKTQAALLEAMQEGSVTAAGITHALPRPFAVLATQNPIEQEGTYRLPEAQLDRFLLAVQIGYPSLEEERAIAVLDTEHMPPPTPVMDIETYERAANAASQLPVPPVVVDYAVRLARSTRPAESEWAKERIAWGCGPRAIQHLVQAARAYAALNGEPAVGCNSVRIVAPLVLTHRLVPSFTALGKGLDASKLIRELLERVRP
jgi:MoxR-like ATPase